VRFRPDPAEDPQAGVRARGGEAAPDRFGRPSVRDTALTVVSLIPAALFWGMVLAGSLHGLVASGRQTLGWRDGWAYLVPGTLDGVSRRGRRARRPEQVLRRVAEVRTVRMVAITGAAARVP
jgi:hypothetical protein